MIKLKNYVRARSARKVIPILQAKIKGRSNTAQPTVPTDNIHVFFLSGLNGYNVGYNNNRYYGYN